MTGGVGGAATRMADAAGALLDLLDDDALAQVAWPFPADGERRQWFYTPTDHGGLALAAMAPAQQRAAMRLLASGLSPGGYVTAVTIVGLENVLDAVEGWTRSFGRERGRDPGWYVVRVFGTPDPAGTWGWRFAGHHVSVHHTIVGGEVVSSTPCFLGANPAASPLVGPHLLRPLGAAEDLGRELVRSLDEVQAAAAMISPVAPPDIVSGNRPSVTAGDGPLPPERLRRRPDAAGSSGADPVPPPDDVLRIPARPVGVAATALAPAQREVLRALLDVYLRRVPDELADAQAARHAAGEGFDRLAFAWAGGTEPGVPHYYRVHGGDLLVEYDNTQDGANHVHTVWRDLRLDFGGDALAAHYASQPHGGGRRR